MIEHSLRGPGHGGDDIVRWLRRHVIYLGVVMAVGNLLVPAGNFAFAAATGEDYWHPFLGEGNTITWFSTVQLMIVGIAAYANHQAIGLVGARGYEVPSRWIWLLFGAGFVFLGLDELLEIHEALRDDVLAPRGVGSSIPFLRTGDFGLYIYLAVGLVMTGFLVSHLARNRAALGCFVGAMLIAASVVVVDGLPKEFEERMSYFWTSVFEEVGEIWAQLLFLYAFLIILYHRLGELEQGPDGDPVR